MTFLYEPIQFLVELLLAEFIFTFWLERREHFLLRLAGCLVIMVSFSIAWPYQWEGLIKMVKYLIVFLLSVLTLRTIFCCSFWDALYRGAAAYATQHIAINVASMFWFGKTDAAVHIISTVSYLAVFLFAYLCFGRRIRKEGPVGVDNRFLTLFILIMLLFVVVLNYVRIYLGLYIDHAIYIISNLYSIVGCLFALFIQSGLYLQSQLAQKLEITEQLLHSKQEQFKVSEETIECINIKCHDLKHQISVLRQQIQDQHSQAALEDIESAVLIYDSVVKTGNDALDVILTEKSLICEKNHIQLTCMVDGRGFASISDTDLYSIFGNILDNAMESAMQLPDPEQRTIGLTVTNTGSLLLIHAENYFDHPVVMEDGLPVTTKGDTRFHGFGMKSIRLIAGHYGGTVSVELDDNIFNLNIMIPVRAESA